jgi:hypothetical protein
MVCDLATAWVGATLDEAVETENLVLLLRAFCLCVAYEATLLKGNQNCIALSSIRSDAVESDIVYISMLARLDACTGWPRCGRRHLRRGPHLHVHPYLGTSPWHSTP